MTRSFISALALCCLVMSAVRVDAQGLQVNGVPIRAALASPRASLAVRPEAPATPKAAVLLVAAPSQAAAKKSFWQTPWPYVIAGAVVVIAVVAAKSGDGYGSSASPGAVRRASSR